jgi:hypothetical protein
MNKTMVCRVTCGELNKDDAIALEMALDDLRTYWEKAFGRGSFLLADEAPERQADLDLLADAEGNLPRVRALVEQGRIEKLQPAEQGFALDIVTTGEKRTAALRATDRLGLQYAVYGFAEQFLGVRFLHPLLDLQPEAPPMPARLRLVESPARPMRILLENCQVLVGAMGTEPKLSHFSDAISWRWEDWAGNPERMRHLIAWAVKNRSNHVMFDDTFMVCSKAELKPFSVSDAVWACLDARGLKTIMWCGPGYIWGAPEGAYSKSDLCNHTAPRVGPWDQHLCIAKPAFWKEADDWLDRLTPHAHRLAALWTNWQENPCGEGATEGHEDGVIHNLSGGNYDMTSTVFRKPVLSKGGGCATCGHMENVDKWVKHLDYLRSKTAACGLPTAGIARFGHWAKAEPDDGIVAERVVPHLPPGSLSMITALPSRHRAGGIEAWPRLMDQANRADHGNRRIVLFRQLIYTCACDIPLVAFSNFDRVDEDARVFGKYESFAGAMGTVFVYHSMGWLLALCSMRKNWQAGPDWKGWFRDYFRGLLGEEFIERFLDIAAKLQDVQLLEGLEDGEHSGGYYTQWGLRWRKLAAESFPANGPLDVDDKAGDPQFVRLVKAGAVDARGTYTSERCAPVLKRILSMRGKLEDALGKLPALAKSLPTGMDSPQWNDLLLQPLRVTARFLQARLLLAQSYLTYIRMRERVLQGLDPSAEAAEGAALCRQALEAQDEYIRLRPGFCCVYPREINPDTLRSLIGGWRRLAGEPRLCGDLDICAFLDRAERKDAQFSADARL